MKNVQISLPDDLARDAAEAGLLSDSNLEQLLRDAIREQRKSALRGAMDRMAASPSLLPCLLKRSLTKLRRFGPNVDACNPDIETGCTRYKCCGVGNALGWRTRRVV